MPRQAGIDAPGARHHIIAANKNHINFHRNAQTFDICYTSNIQPYSQIVVIFICNLQHRHLQRNCHYTPHLSSKNAFQELLDAHIQAFILLDKPRH